MPGRDWKDKNNIFGLATRMSPHDGDEIPRRVLISQKKMILESRSNDILEKLIAIALDDEHPQQGMALKWTGDRMLPMSEFEPEMAGLNNKRPVTIIIGDATPVKKVENLIEHEKVIDGSE